MSDKKLQKAKGMTIEDLFKAMAMQTPDPNDKKPIDEYKFWKTQPVTKFDEEITAEGPIEVKTVDQVDKEPQALLDKFEWSTVDIDDSVQLNEVYELLYENYIEDADETFRFKYSPEFLNWALKPPGYHIDWNVGVRVKDTKKLIGFIAGTPATIKVRDNEEIAIAEINFLCVHKKLRSKRLAPVLIKEVTRRVNLTNVWQAMYTGGVMIPSPISTCRYYHRSINWPKLNDVGFSPLPPGSTVPKQIAKYALPAETTLPNLRKMESKDLDQVLDLLTKFLTRYDVVPVFTKDELEHWLLKGEDVCYAYVVEKDGKITDFVSYYGLESTVLGNDKHSSIQVAYAYYYASEVGIGSDVDEAALAKRLQLLIHNALILAKQKKFDVFNALTLQDNPMFLDELKFGCGDGYLHYYLFNYRTLPIYGGVGKDKLAAQKSGSKGGVGVVML